MGSDSVLVHLHSQCGSSYLIQIHVRSGVVRNEEFVVPFLISKSEQTRVFSSNSSVLEPSTSNRFQKLGLG